MAGELEHRWTERLQAVQALVEEQDALEVHPATTLMEVERAQLLALDADLERAWHSPGATPATRKRIIRTLIDEIVVSVEADALALVVLWLK